MDKQKLLKSALATVIALSATVTLSAQASDATKEKCYGVAKAGKNDCANASGTHSCAGQSKDDHGSDEWNYVAKGSCEKMGGATSADAAKK